MIKICETNQIQSFNMKDNFHYIPVQKMLSDLFSRPALSKEAAGPELKKPKISFKKFNKFSRPDIRKTLLEKILKKGGGKNTVEESSAAEVIYLAIHCTVLENLP